jgi:hypothetical protein
LFPASRLTLPPDELAGSGDIELWHKADRRWDFVPWQRVAAEFEDIVFDLDLALALEILA